mmetsp:Transcript_38991/g.59306  ORF Transcript_38991/g.59306 Transcript_38991/m.59306 type:complete len:113 (+) Transcript_38991:8379-8717(+)
MAKEVGKDGYKDAEKIREDILSVDRKIRSLYQSKQLDCPPEIEVHLKALYSLDDGEEVEEDLLPALPGGGSGFAGGFSRAIGIPDDLLDSHQEFDDIRNRIQRLLQNNIEFD